MWRHPASQPANQPSSIFEEYFPINKVCHNNSLAGRNLQHVTSNVLGVIPPTFLLSVFTFLQPFMALTKLSSRTKEQGAAGAGAAGAAEESAVKDTLPSPKNFRHFRWRSAKSYPLRIK